MPLVIFSVYGRISCFYANLANFLKEALAEVLLKEGLQFLSLSLSLPVLFLSVLSLSLSLSFSPPTELLFYVVFTDEESEASDTDRRFELRDLPPLTHQRFISWAAGQYVFFF